VLIPWEGLRELIGSVLPGTYVGNRDFVEANQFSDVMMANVNVFGATVEFAVFG
jgi:hypothetical protein